MDLKVAAAYVRVSTEDQVEYSPDSQLKLIRDYAKREGYIIPDEYIFRDEGISGKSADKRPAFRLMIATAKEDNRPFDAIFVWKYSRFARNQEEAIMYKNLLRKKGVEVKSISEPSNDSPFSSLIERIIEWMDEYYLINLAGEVKRGLKEKSSRGEPTGKAPLGYTVKDKILVQNDDAETVRFIFDKYATTTVKFRDEEYLLIPESKILAVIE
jgi:DNA invertase Pin-like site-specific DNA recombinase